jgi:dipeptidyl aminopeptidase/acylaminoacyl peptidase
VTDVFAFRDLHDPQVSPEGQWVAYTMGMVNREEDKNEERIWMVPAVGGEAIPLTAEDVSSSHPRWSPDGKYLAFLSARNEGKTQVWLLNRKGGEAQKLTDTPQDVDGFEWSPEGKRLVLVLRDAKPEELEEAKTKEKEKEGAEKEKKTKTPGCQSTGYSQKRKSCTSMQIDKGFTDNWLQPIENNARMTRKRSASPPHGPGV